MNTKFKPEKVPIWVQWIAQDADGWWWGYKTRPVISGEKWFCSMRYACKAVLLYESKPPKDFTQQLYSWGYV